MLSLNRMRVRPSAILGAILLSGISGRAKAESFSSWSAKARAAAQKKQDDKAIEAYASALRLWEKRDGRKAKARALTERASLYEKRQLWDKALKDLSSALAVEPKEADLYDARGKLRFKM